MLRTSQHLLAARQTDELLEVLVIAARDLCSADVAFLNVCNDDGYMVLRATDGALSDQFRNLRIPQGIGINGRVVATQERLHHEGLSLRHQSARANDWLASLLVQGAGLDSLSAAISTLFEARVCIADDLGSILAGDPPTGLRSIGTDALAVARGAGAASRVTPRGQAPRWLSPAMRGEEFLGVIALFRDQLTEPEGRILERATVLTTLFLVNQRSVAEAEARAAADVVQDLVSNPNEPRQPLGGRAS